LSCQYETIPFGIVAAMSRNRVIGINGGLPWKIPDDRRYFKDLTRDRVLILGRRTLLEEDPGLRHVRHARHVVVLSRTLREADLRLESRDASSPVVPVSVARSFPEALDAARRLAREEQPIGAAGEVGNDPSNQLDCWVAGGERVYNEALLHPSADQLHLTVVEVDVDERQAARGTVAQFPAKYRYDNKFRLDSTVAMTDAASGIKYRTDVFKRLKGRR
jgi:dihydrofolate reductase